MKPMPHRTRETLHQPPSKRHSNNQKQLLTTEDTEEHRGKPGGRRKRQVVKKKPSPGQISKTAVPLLDYPSDYAAGFLLPVLFCSLGAGLCSSFTVSASDVSALLFSLPERPPFCCLRIRKGSVPGSWASVSPVSGFTI